MKRIARNVLLVSTVFLMLCCSPLERTGDPGVPVDEGREPFLRLIAGEAPQRTAIVNDPRKALVRSEDGTGFVWGQTTVIVPSMFLSPSQTHYNVAVGMFEPKEYSPRVADRRGDIALLRPKVKLDIPYVEIVEDTIRPYERLWALCWQKIVACRVAIPGLLQVIDTRKQLSIMDIGSPIFRRNRKVAGIIIDVIDYGDGRQFALIHCFYGGDASKGTFNVLKPIDGQP